MCNQCEMLSKEPIKVIDWKSESPFTEDIYHFEEGFKCLYNGRESLDKQDLVMGDCRLKKNRS